MIELDLEIQCPKTCWGSLNWRCTAYKTVTVNSIEELKSLDFSPSAIVENDGPETREVNVWGYETATIDTQNIIAWGLLKFIFTAYKTRSRVRLRVKALKIGHTPYTREVLFQLDLIGYRGTVSGKKRKKLIVRPFDCNRDRVSLRRRWRYEVEPSDLPAKEEGTV